MIELLIVLIIVGAVLFIIRQPNVPIDPFFKTVIYVIVVVGALIWLLNNYGSALRLG